MKSEVVHARVQSNVKTESEKVLSVIGITLSQAIDLFLRQVILKKGLPFKLDSEEKEENDISKLAYLINTVDGKEPSSKAKKIINLYARGDIDLDTAKFALIRMYQPTMKDIYVYPDTFVLINKLNIKTSKELDEEENALVSLNVANLLINPFKIKSVFDIKKETAESSKTQQ